MVSIEYVDLLPEERANVVIFNCLSCERGGGGRKTIFKLSQWALQGSPNKWKKAKKIRKVLQGPQNTKEQIKQDDICLFLLQNMQLHDHMNNMLLVTYKLAILESYISLRDRRLHSLCNSVRTLLYKWAFAYLSGDFPWADHVHLLTVGGLAIVVGPGAKHHDICR